MTDFDAYFQSRLAVYGGKTQEPEAQVVEREQTSCNFALDFRSWWEAERDVRLAGVTQVSLNQCKILLLDKYFAWWASLPETHRSTRPDHSCLHDALEDAYAYVHTLELRLTGPQFFDPPKPPRPRKVVPPPPPKKTGFFGGVSVSRSPLVDQDDGPDMVP